MKKANRGNFGTCAKCRQQILWIKTINGKNMPVNARLITYRVPKEGKGKERIRRSFDCKECGCCTRSFSRVAGEIPATLLKLNISNMKSHI